MYVHIHVHVYMYVMYVQVTDIKLCTCTLSLSLCPLVSPVHMFVQVVSSPLILTLWLHLTKLTGNTRASVSPYLYMFFSLFHSLFMSIYVHFTLLLSDKQLHVTSSFSLPPLSLSLSLKSHTHTHTNTHSPSPSLSHFPPLSLTPSPYHSCSVLKHFWCDPSFSPQYS